jgi:hypothetical protein
MDFGSYIFATIIHAANPNQPQFSSVEGVQFISSSAKCNIWFYIVTRISDY